MTDKRDHLRIFCYHAGPQINNSVINVASLYIRTHFDTTYPELIDQVTWLVPEQWQLTDEQLIDYCVNNQVDILSVSHYLWNDTFVLEQLKRIRTQLPANTIVCSGGPSVRVKIEPDYLEKHWYIDYAFFAQGESGFADLLHSLLTGKKLILFNTSNIAWYDQERQRTQVADFKYIPEPKTSPYLHCADFLREIRANTPGVENLLMAYQLTRGCPYSCTFCDWNSGFTNKTSRRKKSYQAEIDLFQELGFRGIFLVDANVGQYDEDVEIVQYIAHKNLTEDAKFVVNGTLSKLRKDNNMKIWRAMGAGKMIPKDANIIGFGFSIQDINEEVLKNIDRPDVSWQEHKRMINELYNEFPEIPISAQMIYGLPGQTPASWKETLGALSNSPLSVLVTFINEPLATSPAMLDPSYQARWKYEYVTVERHIDGLVYHTPMPASCVSFTKRDMVEMTLISMAFCGLVSIRATGLITKQADLEQVVDRLLLTQEFAILRENLYNNWVQENKFYFTQWFGFGKMIPQVFTACHWFDFNKLPKNPGFVHLVMKNIDSRFINKQTMIKNIQQQKLQQELTH